MSRSLARAQMGAGVLTMVAASLWAPAQPELWQDGGACEIALCGTLEDPERWRAAWWVWGAGLFALLLATPFARGPKPFRLRRAIVLIFAAPIWLLVVAFAAYVTSLSSSVHGAATVVACAVVAPTLSFLVGMVGRPRRPGWALPEG